MALRDSLSARPVWTTRRTLIAGGIAALGVLRVLVPRHPPPLHLIEQQVELDAEPDQAFQQLTSFDQLDPERRQVKFEQLRSPFFSVRAPTEIFALQPRPGGGTLVTLRGVLEPSLGLVGWLVTQKIVRPRWDDIDAKALARLRERV